jgi:hypothetical protein
MNVHEEGLETVYTKALLNNVEDSIRFTMREAIEGNLHPIGSWRQEGDVHHIVHAHDHLEFPEAVTDEELAHALCRLAMALWSRRNGVLGDFGPDGVLRLSVGTED